MSNIQHTGLKKAIIELFITDGTAMHYREITSRLKAQGLVPRGQTPHLTVNSILSRGHEFERVATGTYKLRITYSK